jgi:hypothetical protein
MEARRDVGDGGSIVQGRKTSKAARPSLTNQSTAQDNIKSQDIKDSGTDKRK